MIERREPVKEEMTAEQMTAELVVEEGILIHITGEKADRIDSIEIRMKED